MATGPTNSGNPDAKKMDLTLNSTSSSTLCPNGPSEQVVEFPCIFTCFICREAIMLPQERFSPCACGTILVHTFCALNDEKWMSRKCNFCGQMFQQPLAAISSSSAFPLHSDQSRAKCSICGVSSANSRSGFRSDVVMIRPCLCEGIYHHQCIATRVLTERGCHICGVQYRYRKVWIFARLLREVPLSVLLHFLTAFSVVQYISLRSLQIT